MDSQILARLTPQQDPSYQPLFFSLEKPADQQKLKELFDQNLIKEVIDNLEEAVEDLFKIDFPYIASQAPEYSLTLADYKKHYFGSKKPQEAGIWVYFPWKNSLIHIPEHKKYYKLRTARNKFLITEKEQEQFYNAHIGVAGLSVGSSVVHSLTLSGGGNNLRIGDSDILAITNLNRLQAGVCDLDRSKTTIAARRVYELNPFQKLEIYPEGLSEQNLISFLNKPQKLDLFIEEMDSINLKISSRFAARELGIPVLMVTDNGDNAIVDIERFDLEPDRPLFHGLVKEDILRDVPAQPSMAEKVRLANAIVGPNTTPRTQYSLTQVGSRLPSWPQLGNAASLSGVVASYLARRIICGDDIPSGRLQVNLDQVLDTHYNDQEAQTERAEKTQEFIDGFNLLYAEEK